MNQLLKFYGFMQEDEQPEVSGDEVCGELAHVAIYGCLTGKISPIELHKLTCVLRAFMAVKWDAPQKSHKDLMREFDAQVNGAIPTARAIIEAIETMPDEFGHFDGWRRH